MIQPSQRHPPCSRGGCRHSYGKHMHGPNYGCSKCPRWRCPRYQETEQADQEKDGNGDGKQP